VLSLALVGGTGYAAARFPKAGMPLPPQTQAAAAELAPDAVANFAKAWNEQPRIDLGIPAEGAKVVIVKFNDYQCPGCGATHQWYKPILEKFEKTNPGAIKYVLKDWPWNSKCNFNLTPGAPPNHPGACEGAAAVRMARDRSKALETQMQDWLYANQPTMTPQTVQAAAERILGVKDFAAEYARKLPDIRKDAADGAALHIQTTPTLFINGVRIEQIMPAQYFELAIQLEMKKASGK
jgi:protein-disulfide isomerase